MSKCNSNLGAYFFMPMDNYFRNIQVTLKRWKVYSKILFFTITKIYVFMRLWGCQGAENKNFQKYLGYSLVPTAFQSTMHL